MSQATYLKLWADTQRDLDIMLQREREEFLQPQEDHGKAMKMLATSYIKYLEMFRNLEMAHNHLIHQQKRAAVRKVLDGVMGRILEIKKEMVALENSECHDMDDFLMELKRVPDDIEIPIPKYFIEENLRMLQKREKYLDEILLNAGLVEQEVAKGMTLEEGIKVIQVAERARQGRSRAAFMKRIYLEDKRENKEDQMGKSPDEAATCIQKVWRGYIQRKRTEILREEEMIFLGMSLPPHLEATSSLQTRAGKANVLQDEVQEREDFSLRQQLRETQGPHIKETLQDQISQCFVECRLFRNLSVAGGEMVLYKRAEAARGWIHSQPHPSSQPSAILELLGAELDEQDRIKTLQLLSAILAGILLDTATPEMLGMVMVTLCRRSGAEVEVAEELAAEREAKKKDPKEEKELEKSEKPKPKNPRKVGKQVVDKRWKMGPSNFLSILEEESRQYKVVWENRDHKLEFLQDHDPELIKQEQEEVEEEIRVQVDKVMREKLVKLKLAVDGESGGQSKSGKGEKASKTPRKEKIPRLEKDLTPDRTIDSLYQELAKEGLLIKVQNVNLSDYFGYYDCLRHTHRERGAQPVPSIPDVRQLVALYGILPLGSQTVHENAPLVKSMLLVGPAGVGKKMLVHAICTETGANLFNLTPSNLAGKYPDSDGLIMMLHMILKVGKELQPSVVWIGDTEKIFSKGELKGEEEVSARRLGKLLPHFLTALKAKDRVLLVGTTAQPFHANIGPFCSVYQKIILVPKPDYLTRWALWKSFILRSGGVITKLLNLHCLAQVSDGFTQGPMLDTVHTVLSELRLLQMPRKPLRTVEFVTSLARHDPVYREEEEMFQAWYAKTPLGRAWRTAVAKKEEEKEKKGKGKK